MPDENRQPNLVLALALTLTFSIALIKGGAPQWASLAWVGLCGLSLAFLLTVNIFHKKKPVSDTVLTIKSSGLLPFVFFIGFHVWVLLQHITISQDKAASLDQLLIGWGMVCFFAIWGFAAKHRYALTLLYLCIVIFSIIQAVYGLWVFLSGTDKLLWMQKLYYLDRPTGFFVNANHFAAYVVIAIILCISKTISEPRSDNRQSLLINIFEILYSPRTVVIGILLIALLASKSVGAITSLVLVLGVITLQGLFKTAHRYKFSIIILVLITFVLISILSLDYSTIEDQAADLSHTFIRRFELSQTAFTMLKSNWLLGIGGGGFYSHFSPFRTLSIGNTYYNYAHNDILQFWIEYGLIGVIILCLFVGTIIRSNLRVLAKSTVGINATFAYSSVYCTLAVATHSLVDFPLQMPGFSICYLIIISINNLYLMSESNNGR